MMMDSGETKWGRRINLKNPLTRLLCVRRHDGSFW
jgi:hypothetical protein